MLSYASETWMWNEAQQSQISTVEMSCVWGAGDVLGWDGETNETELLSGWMDEP